METNYKPLVPLLSTKGLDELPTRIQRFRSGLFRFQYHIMHVPGQVLIAADTLSRQPLPEYDDAERILECEVENYTDSFMRSLPASEERLKRIKQLQDQDPTLYCVKTFTSTEWPSTLRRDMRPY